MQDKYVGILVSCAVLLETVERGLLELHVHARHIVHSYNEISWVSRSIIAHGRR